MARRFVRVDLGDGARDFRPVAIEPGVPLLDRPGASAKILFKWLGGMAAEPEWEGDSVNFFVRDDHGGRLEEVICQPASNEDLQGLLKDDLALLGERLEKAKADSSTERTVLKAVRQQFAALVQDPQRMDRDCYFFRYRDVHGRWRLVWCPGYRRTDQEPAAPVICTDPDCNLLFVRRPHKSAKCPGCSTTQAMVLAPRGSRRWPLWVALLLLLLGGGLAAWYFLRNPLAVSPDQWAGPVGSHVEFQVSKSRLFGKDDVSQQAVAVTADARVVRIDPAGLGATAIGEGKTAILFYVGDRFTTATVTVEAMGNPSRLRIEPGAVELAAGATARLKLVGEYEGGIERDLTAAAEWVAKKDSVVFAYDGLVEGVGKGKSTVTARYRASPQSEPLEASADVTVGEVEFQSLELAIEPPRVPLGRRSRLAVHGVAADGTKYSVLESSGLKLQVDPPGLAGVRGDVLSGERAGHGTLEAMLQQKPGQPLQTKLDFDVVAPPPGPPPKPPSKMDLLVGEIAPLDVLSSSEVTSSDPGVVEVIQGNRLFGRSEGKAQVDVRQSDQSQNVDVTVTPGTIQSIAVKPSPVSVPVGQSVPVGVRARAEGGREFDVAPSLLQCDQKPSPKYAAFDPGAMEIRGVRPTDKAPPQNLAFSFQGHKATAPVQVIAGPGRRPYEVVIFSDQGEPVQFPVGAEFSDFCVEAKYPDGFTRIVTKNATLRSADAPAEGPVSFTKGRLLGVRPGKTTVQAEFDGVASKKGLEAVVAATLDIDAIRIVPKSATLRPGETIALEAVGYQKGKSVGSITGRSDLVWNSSDEQVVRMDGPAATGVQPGAASITAQLGSLAARQPAVVQVVPGIAEPLVADRPRIHLWVGERCRIGTDLTISQGGVDVSPLCAVQSAFPTVVQFDPLDRALVGVSPGVSPVTFTRGDKQTAVTVEVSGERLPEGEVVVEPGAATLAPGQAMELRVFLVTRDGTRIDRTGAATVDSRAPDTVQMWDNWACALAPGTAEIRATLPEAPRPGRAEVIVVNERIIGPVRRPDRPVPPKPYRIRPSDRLSIEPDGASVQVGETTPRFVVKLKPAGGSARELGVVTRSQDRRVLAPDPQTPGRFVAVGPGRTQVRAVYGGRGLCAEVTVAGSRFQHFDPSIVNEVGNRFAVQATILAPAAEGALQYRVYDPGRPPPDQWVDAQRDGNQLRVQLVSEPLTRGDAATWYSLMFEARDRAGGPVQQYPYTFQLKSVIGRSEGGRRQSAISSQLSAFRYQLSGISSEHESDG